MKKALLVVVSIIAVVGLIIAGILIDKVIRDQQLEKATVVQIENSGSYIYKQLILNTGEVRAYTDAGVKTGQISQAEVSDLMAVIDLTDWGKVFTRHSGGLCPSSFDGVDTTYTFRDSSGQTKSFSCEYTFEDSSQLKLLVDQALNTTEPALLPE